ncbi:MAG: Nif3-like dinuclear metal center hexameric protein [Methanobrevibacter sp.]|uniref:Nif3-like dinuclear metal center hexameric protein n=1 Tax=Methanobrevibacter sp. TaxID=66852 RepID=UPI0025CF6D64|nr:Nif3-like dinuclear metal center hexameric protein [Methanobrevibacter sp.]MBR6994193.1 Nif3-like dinuclear metal center hexameric protein [Methanobrevibacter sp.]
MKLKDIIEFLESEIPNELAIPQDNIGLQDSYDLDIEIKSIKIYMDLFWEDDEFLENTLIITHHPPLFKPKTPTYTIHSNWDIIKGGANEALANTLNLQVIDYFDNKTKIGRICKSDYTFSQLKEIILNSFESPRVVNILNDNDKVNKIGIISGFGLKNPGYIKLAKSKNLDILISGDLTHETAVLAKNLGITLIDLGHHSSEVPGLYELKRIIQKINENCDVIDKNPVEKV